MEIVNGNCVFHRFIHKNMKEWILRQEPFMKRKENIVERMPSWKAVKIKSPFHLLNFKA